MSTTVQHKPWCNDAVSAWRYAAAEMDQGASS